LFEAMPAAFLPDKAGNAKGKIQFDLGEGGQWLLDVGEGRCEVREEGVTQPDAKVTMSADDFVALYRNELNAVQAFMRGKIRVAGNVGLVMQMLNWFKR